MNTPGAEGSEELREEAIKILSQATFIFERGGVHILNAEKLKIQKIEIRCSFEYKDQLFLTNGRWGSDG